MVSNFSSSYYVCLNVLQIDGNYPYLDALETLVVLGRPIPVQLDQLPQMESQVAAARAWKDRVARTFIKKGCSQPLIEVNFLCMKLCSECINVVFKIYLVFN